MKKITLALTLAAAIVAFGASPALAQTTTLTCVPVSSSVTAGQNAAFLLTGGTGTFAISGTGVTATTTTNAVFNATFQTPGAQSFLVTSGGQTTNCNVTVTAANSGAVMCTPPTGNVSVGQTATFSAAGGNGSFTWTSPGLTITNPTGTSFNATFTTPGIHTVTATSNGQSATCALNVLPASTTPTNPAALICTPASQTANIGQTVSFTAAGGTGSYVWSASDLTINNPTGAGFQANYGTAGIHSVTVTSGTQTSTCTVNVLPAGTNVPNVPGLPNTGFAPAI